MEHDWSWWMGKCDEWCSIADPDGDDRCECYDGVYPIYCCNGGYEDACGCMGRPIDFITCPNGCPWPYDHITYPFLIQIG